MFHKVYKVIPEAKIWHKELTKSMFSPAQLMMMVCFM